MEPLVGQARLLAETAIETVALVERVTGDIHLRGERLEAGAGDLGLRRILVARTAEQQLVAFAALPVDAENAVVVLSHVRSVLSAVLFQNFGDVPGDGADGRDRALHPEHHRLDDRHPAGVTLEVRRPVAALAAEQHVAAPQLIRLAYGLIDAGDYKQYIFPLLFFKRLSDVWDEDHQQAFEDTGDIAGSCSFITMTSGAILSSAAIRHGSLRIGISPTAATTRAWMVRSEAARARQSSA